MLKSHEILGTDKPIYFKKGEGHLFCEDLLLMDENPDKYQIAGYVQVIKFQKVFFVPVYLLTKSYLKCYNKGNLKMKGNGHARIIRFPQKNV